MTVLTNTSLALQNVSVVFSQQNSYTSFQLYYAVIALFSIFMVLSLVLDGEKKPFEKLFASGIAFLFSFSNLLASFSLGIVENVNAGFIQQTGTGNVILTQQQAIVPVVIMQNTITWQAVSFILLILCFINIVNCILIIMDYSRRTGVKKGEF